VHGTLIQTCSFLFFFFFNYYFWDRVLLHSPRWPQTLSCCLSLQSVGLQMWATGPGCKFVPMEEMRRVCGIIFICPATLDGWQWLTSIARFYRNYLSDTLTSSGNSLK
jgi:hypothetical protein